MRLERAILHNICQHRHLDAAFTDATGIFGPNGSGKSNLLRAIKASLTGKLVGTKEDNICRFASSKEGASIRTVWKMDSGDTVTISYGLRPTDRQIEIVSPNGHCRKESGAAKVNELVRALAGVDASIIDVFYFVDQNDLGAFLKMAKSEQMRLLMEILDLDSLEKTWEHLGTVITNDGALLGQGESYEAYDQLIQNAEAEIQQLESALKRLNVLPEEKEKELYDTWQSMQRWLQLKETLNQHQQVVANAEKEIRTSRKNQEDCQKVMAQMEENLRRYEGILDNLKKIVDQAKAAVLHNQRIAHLELLISQQKAACGKEPAKPRIKENAFAESLQQKEAQLASLQYRYETITGTGGDQSKCPVCLQPADLRQMQDDIKQQIDQLSEMIAQLRTAHRENLSQWQRYRADYAAWQSARDTLQNLLKQRQELGERFQENPQAEPEYNRYLEEYQRLKDQYATVRSSYECARKTEEIYTETYRKALKDLRKVEQEMQNLVPYDEQKDRQICETLNVNSERKNEYQKLYGQYRQRLNDRFDWQQKRKAAMERAQKAKKAVVWIEHARQWRETLHRESLGRRLVEEFLKGYAAAANQYLEAFDNPFWLEVTDGSEFIARMPDGSAEKLSRLSKGQSVILSVCLQLAGQALFDANLKVLALDEPTDGLDGKNLGYLADMLAEIVYRVKEFGRQLVVVTHHENLANILDSAIFLAEQQTVAADIHG